MKPLIEIIKSIEKQLPHKKFGFKQTLSSASILDKNTLNIDINGFEKNEEYDCLYVSAKAQELLKKKGIKTDIYSGKDELGIWENHCYLITETNQILDFSPLYPTLGAKHSDGQKISAKEISEYKLRSKLNLGKMIPLHYDSKTKTILRFGIGFSERASFVKYRKPQKRIYIDILEFDKKNKKYFVRDNLELIYSGNQIKGTLQQMLNNKIFEISNKNKHTNRILDAESKIDSYVVNILKKIV